MSIFYKKIKLFYKKVDFLTRLPSLCGHSAITLWSLCHHFVVTLPSLCGHCATTLGPLLHKNEKSKKLIFFHGILTELHLGRPEGGKPDAAE